MAKVTPGPLVGAISGSVGGATFSRNRYGPYIRRRAVVTTVTSPEAMAAKARMSGVSQAWQGLDPADKDSWREWARTNPVVGSLGNSQQLTGHAAYVSLGCRGVLVGFGANDVPPAAAAPIPLVSCGLDVDVTLETANLTFAATPLAATDALFVFACVVDSHGITWVQNLLRYIAVSGMEQATPFDLWGALVGRFGTLYVDQVVHVRVAVFNSTTYLISRGLMVSTIAHAGAPPGP